jgi:hypothetical protein
MLWLRALQESLWPAATSRAAEEVWVLESDRVAHVLTS